MQISKFMEISCNHHENHIQICKKGKKRMKLVIISDTCSFKKIPPNPYISHLEIDKNKTVYTYGNNATKPFHD